MPPLDELPIRNDLRGLSPYGAPQQDASVTLNVNENPYEVPDEVVTHLVKEITRVLPGLNRYPDREFTLLREKLASYLGNGLRPEQLWAANGSNEIMQQLMQAFAGPGRSVLSFTPSYSMYPLLARGVGSRFIGIPREEGFLVSPQLAREVIEREQPAITILCSPNNPTGTGIPLETVEAAYDAGDGILIVDEAYAEFRHDGQPSALELLPGRERLIVSRTMSKAFAFAGARLGYFAADPAIADAVRLVRLPYHLSAVTQAAAGAALDCADVMLGQVEAIRAQRDRLMTGLRELGYSPFPSEANFVLFGGLADAAATFRALRERGILVRDVGLPGTLRVTAGTGEETGLFLRALAGLGEAHRDA